MNQNEQLHETVLRDIVDVVMDTAKNTDSIQSIFSREKVNIKSVSNASSNLILVFPVLVTRSMNIENTAMVCKAIERKAVAMLQMLFSAICITDSRDAFDYISKIHTNMKFDSDLSIDQFMEVLDRHVIEHEQAGIEIVKNRELYDAVREDMKNLKYYLPEVMSERSINDYKIYPDTSRYGDNNIIVSEGYISGPNSNNIAGDLKNRGETFKNQILDSDIKKANELVPTTMVINFVSTRDGHAPIAATTVIGVKAKMYPVDATDVLNRLLLKNKDGNGFHQFIRATTREISFWKDFIFALERAKIDAISSSGRGSSSKIWKLLERRAVKSKVRRFIGIGNDATAITTLVISQEEVELLKKNENIDVEKPRTILPIMEAYNLMCFVIIDEAMEVVKFMYDDDGNMYETLSFNHLERESSDGGYKKVINLMTKMAR